MAFRVTAPLIRLFGTNWITMFGASLTTASGLGIIGFMLLGLLGLADSPYIALMALLVLPGVFVAGLLMIPVGLLWERRRKRLHPERIKIPRRRFPVIDLNHDRVRRIIAGVGILTMVNVLLIAVVSYEGVAYMETTEFCGEVCHAVMEPEFASYQDSPHSRVKCVECHIGPGAPWFVRSKLSGVGQVVAVTLDNYQRPIPTPVENLRPSQDTCEQCHWPHRFTGDPIKVVQRFSDDEANTPLTTVLLMHIGGGTREKGIHSWHIDSNKKTVYATADRERKEVLWVEVRESGEVTRYVRDGAEDPEDGPSPAETRVMDCVDCHNRPTHVYDLPAPAMDEVLADGKVSSSIPFIKKAGVEILEEASKNGFDAAEVGLMVQNHYQQQHPDFYGENGQLVDQAAAEIQGIYAKNVFPRMKVSWGTYPNHIGHQSYQEREDYPGCFRCHNGEFSSADGRTIDQDCSLCHTLLAWEEENPAVLAELGLE